MENHRDWRGNGEEGMERREWRGGNGKEGMERRNGEEEWRGIEEIPEVALIKTAEALTQGAIA
jgi:hypothetical protein